MSSNQAFFQVLSLWRPSLSARQFFGRVCPLWGAKPWRIGCRTDRHAPAGAPRGQHVRMPLPATLDPHRQATPRKKAVLRAARRGPQCRQGRAASVSKRSRRSTAFWRDGTRATRARGGVPSNTWPSLGAHAAAHRVACHCRTDTRWLPGLTPGATLWQRSRLPARATPR